MTEAIRVGPYVTVGAHTQNASLGGIVSIPVPEGANGLLVQAITQNIRYTLDGSGPTPTKGFRLTAGNDPILIPLTEGKAVKFTQETATATLEYQAIAIRGGGR